MYSLDCRYRVEDESSADVETILDQAGIDYDWDSTGRLMVRKADAGEIEAILSKYGIDADQI